MSSHNVSLISLCSVFVGRQEKKALKEEKLKLEEKYMWATVNGVREKV